MSASKFWSPTFGMGMLELAPDSLTFTPDNGPPLAVQWSVSHTGQANQRRCPRRKADEAEWWHWITVTSRSGDVYSFRRGGAPQ